MQRRGLLLMCAVVLLAVTAAACAKKQQPVPRPAPPPDAATTAPVPPRPPEPVAEPVPVPPEPLAEDGIDARSLDDLNRDSPLQPVFFEFDSAEITGMNREILEENAGVLRRFGTWQVTIEGHCDERGTAEYNLALGERRAQAARDYLVALGIPATRLRIVSYGKEFPFDPGNSEAAWAKNRRAHFVITAR